MSRQSHRTAFHAGDFISDDAVRGVLGRRRLNPQAIPTDPARGMAADSPTAADAASSPARRTAPLRRWSVAELLARALATPPAEGLRH
jgi:hypothetical protein